MPIITLDLKTALIVIDLQQGLVAYPTVQPIAEIAKRAAALADRFRHRQLPVVLVNVAGGPLGRTDQPRRLSHFPPGWTDLLLELNAQPNDIYITKHTPGAFTNTGLHDRFKQLNVTQVVIVGVSTSSGVESTARQAYELGFNVTLPIDAMSDMNADLHHNSTTRIFPKLGETGSTRQLLDLIEERD